MFVIKTKRDPKTPQRCVEYTCGELHELIDPAESDASIAAPPMHQAEGLGIGVLPTDCVFWLAAESQELHTSTTLDGEKRLTLWSSEDVAGARKILRASETRRPPASRPQVWRATRSNASKLQTWLTRWVSRYGKMARASHVMITLWCFASLAISAIHIFFMSWFACYSSLPMRAYVNIICICDLSRSILSCFTPSFRTMAPFIKIDGRTIGDHFTYILYVLFYWWLCLSVLV